MPSQYSQSHRIGQHSHSMVLNEPFFFYLHRLFKCMLVRECPSYHVECLTSHHQMTKNYNKIFLESSTDRNARHWSSLPVAWSFTGSHFCKSDLLGTVNYIVFVSWRWYICSSLTAQPVQLISQAQPVQPVEDDGLAPATATALLDQPVKLPVQLQLLRV